MKHQHLCFIDIETTGSIFGYHEVIEVAAIRASAKEPALELDRLSIQIRPRFPERFTTVALELNSYNQSWNYANYSCREVWQKMTDFWSGSLPVCHNPSFERAFISLAIQEAGLKDTGLGYHWIGTESLAYPLFKNGKIKSLSLADLSTFFGFPEEPLPHVAINGANYCQKVFAELMKFYDK